MKLVNSGFLSARPGGARHAPRRNRTCAVFVSIRTPRAGRDKSLDAEHKWAPIVSIRTPRAGRDRSQQTMGKAGNSFYPHAPGGARLDDQGQAVPFTKVSIRTPRAGRDPFCFLKNLLYCAVSIRTPRAGRD